MLDLKVDGDEFDSMTTNELRAACRPRGVKQFVNPAEGTAREVLLQRLRDYEQPTRLGESPDEAAGRTPVKGGSRSPALVGRKPVDSIEDEEQPAAKDLWGTSSPLSRYQLPPLPAFVPASEATTQDPEATELEGEEGGTSIVPPPPGLDWDDE